MLEEEDEEEEEERYFNQKHLRNGSLTSHQTKLQIKQSMMKLEAILLPLYRRLDSLPRESPKGRLNESESYMRLLLTCFDQLILPTRHSRYVHFLLFYLTSFNHNFVDLFLGYLLTVITEERNGYKPHLRVAASTYCASFLARAKWLDPQVVRDTVTVLLAWARQELELRLDQVVADTPSRRVVWYSVIQSLLYVFCFQWHIFRSYDGKTGEATTWWAPVLILPRLVLSTWNPLWHCDANVVKRFASIAHQTKFMYCYTIIEKNKQLYHWRRINGHVEDIRLESFFPFDPYPLEVTSSFIHPLYREWVDLSEDIEKEGELEADDEERPESPGSLLENGEEEEASMLLEIEMQNMSISPPPLMFVERAQQVLLNKQREKRNKKS